MRILFIMRHALYLRNYERPICKLAEEGHKIHLGFTTKRKHVDDTLAQALVKKHPNITFDYPPKLQHPWAKFLTNVRNLRNYVRYFESSLAKCHSLQQRAAKRTPAGWIKFFNLFSPSLRDKFHKKIDKVLEHLEESIPPPEQACDYIKKFKPEFLLISPLLDLDSYEIDYVKAARKMAIPNCLCVASWDNLTNKGIIQGKPNFLVLWNEIQKKEAITLHNIPEDNIYTTGAQLFDEWFIRKPSVSREEFCNKMNLDPNKPIITWLCSSVFISRNEADFVYDWAQKLRNSDDPATANANILIRPHPASGPKYWEKVDPRYEAIKDLTIWPLGGMVPTDDFSKDSYFNTLYWSDTVVGINTSAFIEAGIVKTPCFTIEEDTHTGTQDGTIHFHYLTNGGLVFSAKSMDEHLKQIKEALNKPDRFLESSQKFVNSFVRPHGMKTEASDVFCDRVAHHIPRRFTEAKRWYRKEYGAGKKITHNLLKPFFFDKKNLDPSIQTWSAIKSETLEKKDGEKRAKDKAGKVNGTLDKRENMLRDLKNISKSNKTFIFGPWLCEVGFELLYWIPFLNWIQSKYKISPDQCIAVSRGGCSEWYKSNASRYFDIFSEYTPEEFFQNNEKRAEEAGGTRKHTSISSFDNAIIEKVKKKFDIKEAGIIHPKYMYALYREFWTGHIGHKIVNSTSEFKPFNIDNSDILNQLDLTAGSYSAVKFYHSAHFPEGKSTEDFINRVIGRLADKGKVVVLDTGLKVDDHNDSKIDFSSNVIFTSDLYTAETNLAVQSALVAGANAFYGTYGGFSYLAPLCGINSYNFYAHSFKMITAHLHVANRAFRKEPFGRFIPCHSDSWEEVNETFNTSTADC